MKRHLFWVAGLALLAAAPAAVIANTANLTKAVVKKETAKAPNTPAKERDKAGKEADRGEQADGQGSAVGDARGQDRDAGTLGPDPVGDASVTGADGGNGSGGEVADPFQDDSEGGGTANKPQPTAVAGASWIAGPTPLWLAAAIIALLLLIGGLLLWRLRDAGDRINLLELKFKALDGLVRQLDPPGKPVQPNPVADNPRQPATRIGGYDTGFDAQEDARAPLPFRQPKFPAASFDQDPPPPPRAAAPGVSLAPLQEDVARLLANPAMRTADYDELLRRYGEAKGYEVKGDDGSGRLTPNDGDPARRLTALILTGSEVVALLPSARFIREFVLYKERLEVGSDVKALFELEADGSAHLRIEQLAYGRAGADGTVHGVNRGRLAGFLR